MDFRTKSGPRALIQYKNVCFLKISRKAGSKMHACPLKQAQGPRRNFVARLSTIVCRPMEVWVLASGCALLIRFWSNLWILAVVLTISHCFLFCFFFFSVLFFVPWLNCRVSCLVLMGSWRDYLESTVLCDLLVILSEIWESLLETWRYFKKPRNVKNVY